MSSLLNWDGSQDARKRREEEESTRADSQGDLSAPQADLTHGLNVGLSSSDKRDAMLNNGHTAAPTTTASPVAGASNSTLQGALSPSRISNRYSQNIQFGSAKTLRTPGRGVDGPQVQATVPHNSDGLPVTRTPDLPTPDHDAQKDATRSRTHSQSPTAHVPPRARRLSLQDAGQSDTIMQNATSSSSHDSLPRPHTPPRPQPSPSRIPAGYMEVDEDADGTPDQLSVPLPLPSPSTGADEDAVEAEMVVDDDFSSLRYPSYEGSPTRATQADVEMEPKPAPDTPKISTPHALSTALPLSTSQIGPTTSFARPASPTLTLLDNAAAGPSAHRPPSPLPPPRKKEPLFLSPTPSDEALSANSQDSAPQPQPTTKSDSPKPGWPFFDPAKKMEDYPQPRYTPSEAPEEEPEEQAPRKDKGKGKGKEKEGPPPPRTAKKPTIRGKKAGSSVVEEDGEAMKFGPPGKRRAKKRRVESSESESSEEYEERVVRTVVKKPKIASGAGRDKGKGKAPTTKVNAHSTKDNAQATKVKAGPKSKIVSSDTISISSSSSEDSSPPVQTPHRRKPSKRAPPSDTGASLDSDIEVVEPGSDSDVEVIDGPALKVKRRIRDVFVLMPRMPPKLSAIVDRDKVREAKARASVPIASSSSSSLVQRSPEASSSKPRPRPVGKKPAADASLDNAPRSSTTIPKPMDNSTAKSLTDSLNAMYAANANPSSDSDSEDDIPLSATHKGQAQKTLQSVVGSSKVKRNDTAASTSAPPLTAKKPRLGSTMPPPASTTRMPPPASSSRMPPPPLPASASAPPRRARGAGQRNEVPCDSCQAAGITECVNAPFPSHRRCQRCHEAGTKCSFKRSGGRASSVARSRAGSVVSSRAGSVVPGHEMNAARGRASSVASSRRGSVAPGRAESVAPRVKGTKRPHDGGESASRKRKVLEVEEVLAVPGPSSSKALAQASLSKMRSTSAVAGPSKGRSQAGPSKPRVLPGSVVSITDSEREEEDEADDGEIVEFEVPPGATRIYYVQSVKPGSPGLSNERRVQSFMKYAKKIHDEEEWWLHLMCPEVAPGVLDVEFGDEEDRGFDEGKGSEGGGGEGRSGGAGKEKGKGKGKQKEDQGRRDKEGAGKGKGKQRANGGGYQEGGSQQTLGAASPAPPRTKDSSSKRVPKPRYRPIVPQPELGVHAPAPRYPLLAAQIDPHDAFQPPVVSLASAVSTVAISRPDATNALLAAVENYKAEHASRQTSTVPTPTNARPLSPLKDQSRQTSTVSTPTNALPLSLWKLKYWDSRDAQPREPTTTYMQAEPMHPGLNFEPHQELQEPPAVEDNHTHEQGPFWNGQSSGSHRDFHSDGGEPMTLGSFAAAFAPEAGSSGLASSAQPGNEPSAVPDAAQLDDVASPGSSQTLHGSEGRSQTIDPSVLGGMGSFMPADEDSPIKSRYKSSENESEPELPDIPDPSSDEDFKPTNKPRVGPPKRQLSTRQSKRPVMPEPSSDDDFERSKERVGPPKRRASTREVKPSRKRKMTSETEYSDVVEVPADPTKLFKKGTAGIQWPLGTVKQHCHQCRRTTMRRHMYCTSGKVRRKECAKAFCEGCLVTRYGNIYLGLAFDGTEKWNCPVCDGFCNCTICTRGRGEVYLGVRVQKHGEGSRAPLKRAVKSANYGPKSVVAKRKQAQPQPASPAPRPAVKRIRLLPPKPPKSPAPPSEPWVPPKMDYEWPAGVRTELFAPDGYPCGYMWVNEQGQCVTTYTREVIIPGIDADGELYWSEGDVQSSSSSEASEEEEEESSYEEPPPPPRRKRVPRRREYVGARPLPPPVVKKLWFPHSRKFKFSPEVPDFAGQPGAFVGNPPPKFKEGPMSQAQIEFMENYPFSDEELDMDESVHDDEPPGMPGHTSQNPTETIHEPSSAPVPAIIPPPVPAPALADPSTTAQVDASALASVPSLTPEVRPVSSEESDDGPDVAPSPLTAIGDEDDEEQSANKQWPNDFTRPPTEEVASPAPQFNATHLPELLQRISPAAPPP
ncbi:hypothetical protein PENSPDRAFT_681261 [Peniophora sp. CONT]|nr:hypothetical protein PENSPDRAFT_681261 [Peniophora sp. CONT]